MEWGTKVLHRIEYIKIFYKIRILFNLEDFLWKSSFIEPNNICFFYVSIYYFSICEYWYMLGFIYYISWIFSYCYEHIIQYMSIFFI
jgi:hypothetical protein